MMLKIASLTFAGGAAALAGALGFGTSDCTAARGGSVAASGQGACCAQDASASSPSASASAADAPLLYVEARDATVWGGACHVSAQKDTGGARAACGWAFDDARVVLAVEGTHNLQGHDVFNTGEAPEVRVAAWVDAPDDAAAEAALARALRLAPGLPAPASVERAAVTVAAGDGGFEISVAGVLQASGEDVPDGACCSMPEARWYTPLAEVGPSVVGFAGACRFEGGGGLGAWTYEGENSVFIARDGARAPGADS